jgi:hypothetical protein
MLRLASSFRRPVLQMRFKSAEFMTIDFTACSWEIHDMEPLPQKPLTMTTRRAHAAYDADCERQGVEQSDSARFGAR